MFCDPLAAQLPGLFNWFVVAGWQNPRQAGWSAWDSALPGTLLGVEVI
jgi:hypothetical protein